MGLMQPCYCTQPCPSSCDCWCHERLTCGHPVSSLEGREQPDGAGVYVCAACEPSTDDEAWAEVREVVTYRLGADGFTLQLVRTEGGTIWALLDPAGDVAVRGEGELERVEDQPRRT